MYGIIVVDSIDIVYVSDCADLKGGWRGITRFILQGAVKNVTRRKLHFFRNNNFYCKILYH